MMKLTHYPYLYSDSCIVDKNYHLVFISLWGRDTAIQELLAKITLNNYQEILQLSDERFEQNIYVDKRRYQKESRRYKATRFGTLVHTFIYDEHCIKPNQTDLNAMVLNQHNPKEAIWSTFKQLCPLPVLEHWKTVLLELLSQHKMLETLITMGNNNIKGYYLKLDLDKLQHVMSELIQSGCLDLQEIA